MKNVKPISARQMGEFARLLEERGVGGDLIQKWMQEKMGHLAAFMKGVPYDSGMAKFVAIQKIMGKNFIGPSQVIEVLNEKDIKINLAEEERVRAYQEIPFSKSLLRKVANGEWRGKRAILWWAPPKRFDITMLKLREAFGTNPDNQPCVYDINAINYWSEHKSAKEVLPSGWHLTLAEVPDETLNKRYDQQKELMTKNETLVKPVELMFLTLVNYEINTGERLFKNVYVGTDSLDSYGGVIGLGGFVYSLRVAVWSLSRRRFRIGLVFSRKFD